MKDLFTASKEDKAIIKKIASRAAEIYKDQYGMEVDVVDIDMDLEACHCNGCYLDLERMLSGRERDLMHDITGINEHLNRETGALEDCFLPRHAVCKTINS